MSAAIRDAMDPLIEGYLAYLDKVGRKTPRTIIDVKCTLRRAMAGLDNVRPGVDLWRVRLEDFLIWLEGERQLGRTDSCLAKYLSHIRGLLEYAWRSGRAERNVLDGFSLQHTLRKTGPLFFINRRANQTKILYSDRTGFCIWAKRLEEGRLLSNWRDVQTRELD